MLIKHNLSIDKDFRQFFKLERAVPVHFSHKMCMRQLTAVSTDDAHIFTDVFLTYISPHDRMVYVRHSNQLRAWGRTLIIMKSADLRNNGTREEMESSWHEITRVNSQTFLSQNVSGNWIVNTSKLMIMNYFKCFRSFKQVLRVLNNWGTKLS